MSQHNKSPYDTEEFLKLKKTWDQKLKDSGFQDEEDENGFLKWDTRQGFTRAGNRKKSRSYHESRADYYRLAEHFLNEAAFQSEKDKLIWTYHADGVSIRKISETLKIMHNVKIAPTQVKETIHKYRKVMLEVYLIKNED